MKGLGRTAVLLIVLILIVAGVLFFGKTLGLGFGYM